MIIGKKNKKFNEMTRNKDEYSGYPTKEEYEENIRQINKKELASSRFEITKEFIEQLNQREYRDLEEKLFSIVGSYSIDDKTLYNKKYSDKKLIKLKRFYDLKRFMDSLTPDQIQSNKYLKAASLFIETSVRDCEFIIKSMQEKAKDLSPGEKQTYNLDVDIPKDRLTMLPTRISETTKIPYYRPEAYRDEYVYLLDEDNRYVYDEYNKYVNNIIKLVTDIYNLQIWNLATKYEEEINNYGFSILNNKFEHKFMIAFAVRKKKENIEKDETKLYELSERTRNSISRIVGLPFEDIVRINPDILEAYISQRMKQYNLSPCEINKESDIENIEQNSSDQVILRFKNEGEKKK